MDENLYQFNDLGEVQILAFEERLIAEGIDVVYRRTIREFTHKYLSWLKGEKLFDGNLSELFPRMRTRQRGYLALPKLALEYRASVAARLHKRTARTHGTALKSFYRFAESHPLQLRRLNRKYMEGYMIYLAKLGHSPGHRLAVLACLRQYFSWLFEHGHINREADDLIRRTDFPKIPTFLPRPLSPDIDRLLQERLSASESNLHKALLLQRRTGLRVGEVYALKFDCVKTDVNGNYFLKVELGKLKTERLVPLDPTTLELVRTIQRKTKEYDPRSTYLVRYYSSRYIEVQHLQLALNDLTRDLKTERPIVSHQLRHTFATTMLSAGMNLVALRDILGHRDIRMTLRYAAITQTTVREEYFKAIKNFESKYELPEEKPLPSSDMNESVTNLMRLLKKQSARKGKGTRKKMALVIRRLQRIEADLRSIRITDFI
jgi:site-specific recombinase XerD